MREGSIVWAHAIYQLKKTCVRQQDHMEVRIEGDHLVGCGYIKASVLVISTLIVLRVSSIEKIYKKMLSNYFVSLCK